MKYLTVPSTVRVRAIARSIASARAIIQRCEARLDTSRQHVLRADAVARRVRVYLDAYDNRCNSAASDPLSAEDGRRRSR